MTRIDGRGRRPESRRPEPGSWQDHYELCHLAGQVALAHIQAGEPYAPPGPPDPEMVRVFARGAAHYGRLTLGGSRRGGIEGDRGVPGERVVIRLTK